MSSNASGKHWKLSDEARKNISLGHKGINTWMKGRKFSEEIKKKISEARKGRPSGMLGKKHSEITKVKMREIHRNENAYNWKGNEVSYRGLHYWIERNLGKPTKCEHCSDDRLNGREIHWANKSGKYKRNLFDWLRLCRFCHMEYDKLNRRKNNIYA